MKDDMSTTEITLCGKAAMTLAGEFPITMPLGKTFFDLTREQLAASGFSLWVGDERRFSLPAPKDKSDT
jgi:hypothetical protein